MKTITVSDDSVSIRLTGWDMIWAFKRSLLIPFSCISEVYGRPKELKPPWIRAPGTQIPGVIVAGTYFGRGRKEFWSCRYKSESMVFDLKAHRYTRVVIDIDDARRRIEEIQAAFTPTQKNT